MQLRYYQLIYFRSGDDHDDHSLPPGPISYECHSSVYYDDYNVTEVSILVDQYWPLHDQCNVFFICRIRVLRMKWLEQL